jgi:hypothetical protein
MKRLAVNTPQHRALTSRKKIIVFVAGLGVGKSFCLGVWSQVQARRAPNTLGLIVASTKEQFRDSTWPALKEAWEAMGVIEGEHYVVGCLPPKEWGVPPYHPSVNTNILTWCWGGYVKFGSTENFNAHRGPEYDWIGGDELRDWKPGAREVLIGRLRGKAFRRAGIVSQAFLVTTPPDDPDDIEKLIESDSVEIIEGSTFDNLKNLPPDYIETQRAILDELTFRREVMGERISVAGTRAAYAFTKKPHPEGNVAPCPIDLTADLWMTWDFNTSSTRPMTTLLVQEREGRTVVVKEFVNPSTNTPAQAEMVYDWLVASGYRGDLWCTGDHTGTHAGRSSAATRSDYRVIEEVFRSSTQWRYQDKKTRRTRRVKDRVAALNARVQRFSDKVRYLVIDPSCTHTIAALQKLKWKENGHELEENAYREPFDALSYYAYNEHPTDKAESRPANFSG